MRGHLHHAVLEEVRLDGAIGVQRRLVADAHQVELAQVGGLHIHPASNLRAQQPEVPADKGRAGQRADQERFGQMLVQGVEQPLRHTNVLHNGVSPGW